MPPPTLSGPARTVTPPDSLKLTQSEELVAEPVSPKEAAVS